MKGDYFKVLGDILIIGIPVLALLGCQVPVVLNMYNLVLLGIYLTVPMLVAPSIYLLFCKDENPEDIKATGIALDCVKHES